jgi:hypothetical protein
MNRGTTIFEGKSLVIGRFDHPKHCSDWDPESERTEQTVVTFVERGIFELMEDRECWVFSPGDVLVSAPGLHRRYLHFESCPEDVYPSVKFAPEIVEDALGKLSEKILSPKVPPGIASNFAFCWIIGALRSGSHLDVESATFTARRFWDHTDGREHRDCQVWVLTLDKSEQPAT